MDGRDIARGIILGIVKAIGAIAAVIIGVMAFFYLIIWLMVTFK